MQADSEVLRKLCERQAAWKERSSPGSTLKCLREQEVMEVWDDKNYHYMDDGGALATAKGRTGSLPSGTRKMTEPDRISGGWSQLLELSTCSPPFMSSTASSSSTTTVLTPSPRRRSTNRLRTRANSLSGDNGLIKISRSINNIHPHAPIYPGRRSEGSLPLSHRQASIASWATSSPDHIFESDMLSSQGEYSYSSSPASIMIVSPHSRMPVIPPEGRQVSSGSGSASGSGYPGKTFFGGVGGSSASGFNGLGYGGEESSKKTASKKDGDKGKAPKGGKDHKKKTMKGENQTISF